MTAWWIAAAWAGPEVVVTFDNGGFNLPLYTSRFNGHFEQPSVARQLMADLSRALGRAPRVFTYLPPGTTPGRSSDPYEVVPRAPGCVQQPCPCTPGDRCWDALDVNRDPRASTSLYQAATAVRQRVDPATPRLELHFTDLFEEDPSAASDPSKADRCVTADSTRRALEGLLTGEEPDHVAVGLLGATIAPPARAGGAATAFVAGEDGCWSGRRLPGFAAGQPIRFGMAVIALGYGTAGDADEVGRLLSRLGRQLAEPLQLELVVVREPERRVESAPTRIGRDTLTVALPALGATAMGCEQVQASAALQAAGRPIAAGAVGSCDAPGALTLDAGDLQAAHRALAGLDPRRRRVPVEGEVRMVGDLQPTLARLRAVPDVVGQLDRPLPHWDALVQALRVDDVDGVVRPPAAVVLVRSLEVEGMDGRPWWSALWGGLASGVLVGGLLHRVLARRAADVAFREHLGASQGRPLGAVIEAAERASRRGARLRVAGAVGVGLIAGASLAAAVLLVAGGVGG